MKYEIQLKAQAIDDMIEAFDWYESQREGLGKRFLDEIEKYFELIAINPESWQLRGDYRIAVLSKFPFKIIFACEEAAVIVLRVFHARRNPGLLIARPT